MTEQTAQSAASVTAIALANMVIRYHHKHGTSLFAATGSNALKLIAAMFNSSARLKAVLSRIEAVQAQPAGADKPSLRSHAWFWRAMSEVLTNNRDGSPTPALARLLVGRPDAVVAIQASWVDELLTWLVVNDKRPDGAGARGPRRIVEEMAAASDVSEAVLALTERAFEALTFVAPAQARLNKVEFLSSGAMETCEEYRELVRDKWKPEAISDPKRAVNVLGRYLCFMNNLEGGFELEPIVANADGYQFYVY